MKRISTILAIATLLFASTMLLKDVLALYIKDDLASSPEAIKLLHVKAKAGETDAQFLLASAYKNGKLGVKDFSKALYWYKEAAKNGDSDAMLMIGWIYYKAKDEKRARIWFKKAASLGVDEAVEMLEMLQ